MQIADTCPPRLGGSCEANFLSLPRHKVNVRFATGLFETLYTNTKQNGTSTCSLLPLLQEQALRMYLTRFDYKSFENIMLTHDSPSLGQPWCAGP